MDILNILIATMHIERDGVEGFYKVEKLVGKYNAIVILGTFLRKDFNPEGVYGKEPEINLKVFKYLSDNGYLKIDSFRGEFRWLSNFFPVKIKDPYDGLIFPSVEHAYQSKKTMDIQVRHKILNAETAGEAKRIGSAIKTDDKWEESKQKYMTDFLMQKFSIDNPLLMLKLIETAPFRLIEGNSHNDTYWGMSNGNGENNLGKILMKIRENHMISLRKLEKQGIDKRENWQDIANKFSVDLQKVSDWNLVYNLCKENITIFC